jgi:hypothetical protein
LDVRTKRGQVGRGRVICREKCDGHKDKPNGQSKR